VQWHHCVRAIGGLMTTLGVPRVATVRAIPIATMRVATTRGATTLVAMAQAATNRVVMVSVEKTA